MKTNVTYMNSNDKVVLNAREMAMAADLSQTLQKPLYQNTGAEIDTTTLTAILKSVTDQKFFTIKPADYLPVVVGEGQWSSEILKYRSFYTGDDFATGVVNTGASNSRLAATDAAVDALKNPVLNWAKANHWSLIDLQQAAAAGNWDLITQKEKSRKVNWDLGIQEVAFLGLSGNNNVEGFLSLSNVNSNTSLITKYIKDMSDTEFNALLAGLFEAYRANGNRTAIPTHFTIPEADYNGLASARSATYPIDTKLEALEKAFRRITQNENFKVLPCAYGDAARNGDSGVGGLNRYVLSNYDEDSFAMHIPVDYTATLAQSINDFQYQNVAYGQFTGVQAYRPGELLYFDWS